MAKSLFEQIVDRSIISLTEDDLKGVTLIGPGIFTYCSSLNSIDMPTTVVEISHNAFQFCAGLKNIKIPSSVKKIGKMAFSNGTGSMNITNAYFYQPAGMTVTLPATGSNSGMFYVKTARNMNVYTDNETIKNYNWSSDNITATLYHLDGTKW